MESPTHNAPAYEDGRAPEELSRYGARRPVTRASWGVHNEAPHWTVTPGMIDSLCRDARPSRIEKKQERPCGSSPDSLDVVQAFLSGSTAG